MATVKVPKTGYSFLQIASLVIIVTLLICATVLSMNERPMPDMFGYVGTAALGVLFGLPLVPQRETDARSRRTDRRPADEIIDEVNAG